MGVYISYATFADALHALKSRGFGGEIRLTARQRYRRRDTGISINRRFLIELKFAYFIL
jgi:hypothetical protein